LLVLGRPLIAFLWALPAGWAPKLARASKAASLQMLGSVLTNAFVAWLIHAVVLWTWHVPTLFQATLTSDAMHAAQHASFLGSALLFWWAVMHGQRRALGYGVAVLYLFTTALHSGLLGALLTFAGAIWYPAYAQTTAAWGLTPLEDQQLGGLIMWIPAGLVYIIAGLALFAGWLRESETRAVKRDRSVARTRDVASAPRADSPASDALTERTLHRIESTLL
jgi:putative membrane protein